MAAFVKRSRLEAPAEEVFAWHSRAGAFERLSPPWAPARVVERSGGLENGSRLTLRVPAGPFQLTWVAEHRDVEPGRGFRDVQVRGPFRRWEHEHRIEPDGATAAFLEDRIEYAAGAGSLLDGLLAARLARVFDYRHATLAADLADHARCRGGRATKLAVSGATGLVGSALCAYLEAGGHGVTRIVRGPAGPGRVRWNPSQEKLDAAGLAHVQGVVHLAGENIAEGRWSEDKKRRIRDSRVSGTRLLAEGLARMEARGRPQVLVCASAIGFYGNRGEERLSEQSAAGRGFLPEVSQAWEGATAPAAEAGLRVVLLRLGLVLTPLGGALGRMLAPFRLGVGGRIGSGSQWMSWIALDDALAAVHHALLEPSLHGPVNAVSPRPVANAEFTRTLGRVLARPTPAALPAFAARLAFGEMADALLLSSARVLPEKLLGSGYRFRHPELEGALRHLLGR